ncbi:MAG TPA: sugar ABC transporter ATP-binding protein [Tepidisphaeraceae bacterium]|nr:sugar ABC transporter ATP-binding protein [Tepidisphaeraceae bacterium]
MKSESLLLKLTGIAKSFGGVQALRGVCFELARGEIHALVGENGAGKSTLVKVITGAHAPDAGTLEIDGHSVTRFDPRVARSLGIAAIYQQPALFPDLTVAENLALRLERGGAWRFISWRQRERDAKSLLARVGAAQIPTDAPVRELTMPQQQLVEIAGAVGSEARILILDEPTASLGERDTHNLFRVLRELRDQGVGMVYISHRLDELASIADRVSVFRDGGYVGTYPMAEVDPPRLIRLMVGRDVSAVFPKLQTTIGQTILEMRKLHCAAAGVHDVNLHVRAGEVLGLGGLTGAGRTELARVLFGLTPADRGEILLKGRPVSINSPTRAVEFGIAYLPEDRRRHGVILDLPVAANTTLTVLGKICKRGMIDFKRERELSADFVRRMGTKTPSVDMLVGNLSGGNQQKVALSKWLATEPAVVILDEPTQGVDIGAKAEIHRQIGELAARGMAIILISSELMELLGMSDRIAVMHGGRVAGVLDRADATQEAVLALALGHASGAGVAA